MLLGILYLTIISSFAFHTVTALSKKAICKPWTVPVALGLPASHIYHPFFVEMNRCMGQCHNDQSPDSCQCVAHQIENVTVFIHDALSTVLTSITIQNHTSCKDGCADSARKLCTSGKHNWDEKTCNCSCPAQNCSDKKTWNDEKCQCVCSNPRTKCRRAMFWDKNTCACTCNLTALPPCSGNQKTTLNKKTCRFRNTGPSAGQVGSEKMTKSETKLVIALVVIVLLLSTIFVIDLVLMCSQKGFIYGVFTKCTRTESRNQNADTGSINDLDLTNHAEPMLNGNCDHKKEILTNTPVACV